jgi:hypothetical protein
MFGLIVLMQVVEDVLGGAVKAEQAKACVREVRRGLRPGEEEQIVDLHRKQVLPGLFTPAELDVLSNPATSPGEVERLSQIGMNRARRLELEVAA